MCLGKLFCELLASPLHTSQLLWCLFVATASPCLGRCGRSPGATVAVSWVHCPCRTSRACLLWPFVQPLSVLTHLSWHFKVMATRLPVTCRYPPGIFCLHFNTPQFGPQGCLRRLEHQRHHALCLGLAFASRNRRSSLARSTVRCEN